MGDFNTAATETPYRILRSNAVLNDAWLVKVVVIHLVVVILCAVKAAILSRALNQI